MSHSKNKLMKLKINYKISESFTEMQYLRLCTYSRNVSTTSTVDKIEITYFTCIFSYPIS